MVKKVDRAGQGQQTTQQPQPGELSGQSESQRAPGSSPRSRVEGGGSWGMYPAFNDNMTFREIGSSGLRAFSGWVREEFLPQLVGRNGMRAYREMLDNNAVVGGIVMSIVSTMRKVDWRVLPPDNGPEDQAAIDFVESLRDDMSHTWEDSIVDDLSMLIYGFAPKEIVYKKRLGDDPGSDPDRPGHELPKSKYDDGKIGWRRLPLRGQDTILKWFFDENGQVKGMTQQPWVGPIIDIPIEKLLIMRPTHWKNNPEGRSILRSAYRSYWFIKRLEEQEAIYLERLNGFPVLRLPSDLLKAASEGHAESVSTVSSWKKIAQNIRVDEQMCLLIPSNTYQDMEGRPSAVRMYDIELLRPSGGAGSPNTKDMIDRYGVNMMISTLADFLHLGHAARGTQALADQKVDMFFQAVEGFLNATAAVYNRYALPRVFRLNGMDLTSQPQITPDLAQRVDLDVLSNFVLRLSQSGMPIFPNDDIQQYLLDAAGMPDVTDDQALEFAGMTPELISDQTDRALNPPEPPPQFGAKPPPDDGSKPPPPMTKLEKMIAGSLARRVVRMQGNKFSISTRKRVSKRAPRLDRIERYTSGMNGHAK